MQASTQGSPQTFQMSLVEPLILVLIPLSGIYLAVRLLLSRPMEVSFFLPILLLAFCIYGLYWGLTMPRKLEFRENEITIKYLDWKRTVIVSDIKSYSYDKERAGRRTQYFLGIQLHQGRVIKLRDIKGGPRSLLQALEERTGLKPTIDLSDKPGEPAVEFEFHEHRPPEPLSPLTEKLVQKMFPPEEQMEVRQLLINECGNNVYAHGQENMYGLESLRFSALKLSRGDLKNLHRQVRSGNEDFRNLLYGSGFCGEKGEENQRKWVRSILGEEF